MADMDPEMAKTMQKLNDIANMTVIISYAVSNYQDARNAAHLLYTAGYRRVEGED